ncbi:MAG: hypothetical protein QM764_24665 [Chitinophagaceae bacterium]
MTTKKKNRLFYFTKKKVAIIAVLSFFGIGAFATLGDGSAKKSKDKNILSDKTVIIKHGTFSLKSGYNFRGTNVINPIKQEIYINLNTVATYERGNRTYILPIKSKVLLNNVKISAGIPQINR